MVHWSWLVATTIVSWVIGLLVGVLLSVNRKEAEEERLHSGGLY